MLLCRYHELYIHDKPKHFDIAGLSIYYCYEILKSKCDATSQKTKPSAMSLFVLDEQDNVSFISKITDWATTSLRKGA